MTSYNKDGEPIFTIGGSWGKDTFRASEIRLRLQSNGVHYDIIDIEDGSIVGDTSQRLEGVTVEGA
jgi:hypothetical protein